jgi:adenosylcobyric acid synthase
VVRAVTGHVLPQPGLFSLAAGARLRGYEIHTGRTPPQRPLVAIDVDGGTLEDGASSEDGWVAGTHVHGLLDDDAVRRPLLQAVAARRGRTWSPGPPLPGVDAELDRLADAVLAALDMNALRRIVDEGVP